MSKENNKSKIEKLEAEYIKNKSAAALGGLIKLSKMGKYDMNTLKKKMKQVSESEQIEEKKKKKKKSSGKKDACYYKVKSRYKVWPSAYASGALVKCRKVGAKNWGTGGKKKNEEIELEEIYLTEDEHISPAILTQILKDEGGAAGLEAFTKALNAAEQDIIDALEEMPNVGKHEDGDYILEDGVEIIVNESAPNDELASLEEKKKKRKKKKKKAGSESSKESSLRDWFGRKGAKGKKSGWVDCNAPDGKGGYKACGRSSGEKRKRYPACRPTPAACKERGRGKSWGKKGAKRKGSKREHLIRQVASPQGPKASDGQRLSEGLAFHVSNNIPVCDNIYRHGSNRYFDLVNETRELWKEGKINLCEADVEVMESDLGSFVMFRGKEVPLDFPMFYENKKKKDPPLNKPKRNTGSGKKYVVYVRNPKSGNIKKITYGDKKGGLEGNWNSAEARKSYAARHRCADKKDKTKAGYWACRAHKDFGNNVPGRFW